MFLLTIMQLTDTLKTFCVALGVAGKGKCGKTDRIVRERQQQNCIVVKIVLFSKYSSEQPVIQHPELLWLRDTHPCAAV